MNVKWENADTVKIQNKREEKRKEKRRKEKRRKDKWCWEKCLVAFVTQLRSKQMRLRGWGQQQQNVQNVQNKN